MDQLTTLLIGFALSFIGSIPVGMINMTVADTAIKHGLKAGLWMGLGAASVEFFQSFIAIKFTYFFSKNPSFDFYFNVVALIIFLTLAVYYLFVLKPAPPQQTTPSKQMMDPFFKGILVSSMNVLAFPYWIFYGAYLSSNGWLIIDNNSLFFLCLGVLLGAFGVFFLFAKMGTWIINRGPQLIQYVNRSIGFIFIAFSCFQLWKLIR